MKIEKRKIEVDGNGISTIVTTPDKKDDKVAVLLHGGPGGDKDGPEKLFLKMSEELANNDIASIRFDFSGEGESDGEYIDVTLSKQVKEFKQIVKYAFDLNYKKIGIVGESLGATCALGGLCDDFDVLALLWPAIYMFDNTFASFVTDEKLSELNKNGFLDEEGIKIGKGFIDELYEIDNLENQVRKINIPTLLIHGDSDTEVPHRQSEKAYGILKEPKKLIIVPKGDHCLSKPAEQKIVIEETVSWIKKFL